MSIITIILLTFCIISVGILVHGLVFVYYLNIYQIQKI